MRRVTWMVRLHQCDPGLGFVDWRISWVPMQRTNYYMPWGVVTVDELHKMDVTRPLKKETDSGYAIASLVNAWD